MRVKKGSVTVFLSMLLTAVLVISLVLAEAARSSGLKLNAQQAGQAAIDSVLAGFDRELLEEYGLLFYDSGFGKGLPQYEDIEAEFETYFMENAGGGLNLLGGNIFTIASCDAEVTRLVCATDGDGAEFVRSVLEYYQYEAPMDLLAKAAEGLEAFNKADHADRSSESLPSGEDLVQMIEEAGIDDETEDSGTGTGKGIKDSGSEAGNVTEDETGDETGTTDEKGTKKFDTRRYQQEIENSPIGGVAAVKAHGWLNLVMPTGSTISGRTIRAGNLPSETIPYDSKALGNVETEGSSKLSLKERALFNEYILNTFPCYTDEVPEEAPDLHYEVEYILYGKDSDEANLKTVINRLMWVREGLNFIYACGNARMRREAFALAEVMVGWTEMPFLIPIVQYALIAAWAYAESICDLRILLENGKVPLYKDEVSWKLNLENVTGFLTGHTEGIHSSEEGLTYRDYLRVLLYGREISDSAFRTMDLIQLHMQQKNSGFLMASQVCSLTVRVHMEAQPMFTGMPVVYKNVGGAPGVLTMYRLEERFEGGY